MEAPASIGKEKDMDEMAIKNVELEALDKEFQDLLHHITGDDNLEKYRSEYEKLYKAFRLSFDNEKRLVKRCKDLNEMIMTNAASVKAALEMSQEDSNTIKRLKREIEKAWVFVDKAKDKEEKSKKMVQELKSEITHLNTIVEQGATLSLGPENNVHELLKTRDDLVKQCDEKQKLLDKQGIDMTTLEDSIAVKQNEIVELKRELTELKELKERSDNDCVRKEEGIKKVHEQLGEIKKALDKETKEKEEKITLVAEFEQKLAEANEDTEHFRAQFNAEKLQTASAIEENKKLLAENKKKEEKEMKTEDLLRKEREEKKDMKALLNEKENELKKRKNENDTLTSERNSLEKKWSKAEEERSMAINARIKLERDLMILQKQIDGDNQTYQSLRADNNSIRKKVKDAEGKNKDNEEKMKEKANDCASLANQLSKKKADYAELQKEKEKVEAEKGKLFARVAKTQSKVQQLQEDCKLKDNLRTEIERKMIEYKEKAKEKEQLYEVVRSDRNLYSKNLIEAQDEMNELKRKFEITMQQINQLKEELEAKDKALVSSQFDMRKERKMKEKNEIKVQQLEKEIEESKKALNEKQTHIDKLTGMLRAGEASYKKAQKNYEDAIREKDVYGTELIRRNDELTLLCEKIKILQSTLAKGEVQFKEKEAEIRMLMTKIAQQKAKITVLDQKAGNVEKLKREIYNLANALTQERMQVQALSEELENPINVHRWRKLEGTDPDSFEMTQKIQALQKRLIKKTEEVVDRDVKIQEKEGQIQQLKLTLARQPGPETADAINVYQQNLKEKTKQMKAMAAELNMYQAQVFSSYKIKY